MIAVFVIIILLVIFHLRHANLWLKPTRKHVFENYIDNVRWLIKTDDDATLFWTAFGFGKWF